MDFFDNIESIDYMGADELEHFFDSTWQQIEALYLNPNMKPEATRGYLERQVEYNLKTLAHSVKKSLIHLFPDHKDEIFDIDDANEAWWANQSSQRYYPLYEGVHALMKLYSMQEQYKGGYSPNERDWIFSEFKEMEGAVKNYKMHVADAEVQANIQKRHKSVTDGQKGGEKRRAVGIVQAIVDHCAPHRRHLCKICERELFPLDINEDSIWNRFKKNHSCNVNFKDDFDEAVALQKAYRARTRHKEYLVFFNKHTNQLTSYCPGDGPEAHKTWSKGTLHNNITKLTLLIKKK